jgi:hypothetical protein
MIKIFTLNEKIIQEYSIICFGLKKVLIFFWIYVFFSFNVSYIKSL